MRRPGRMTPGFFPPAPAFFRPARTLIGLTACLALLLACLPAALAAQNGLRDPAGLRSPREASPSGKPHVIPPSTPISALEERHSVRERSPRYIVRVDYPSVGVAAIDQATAVWCRQKMDTFTSGLDEIPADDPTLFSLTVEYRLFQASNHTVSIVFLISTDTGGGQPEQGVATFTYDLRTGHLLDMDDIFSANSGLPAFLSFYSRRELAARDGVDDISLLNRGTTPDALNFSCFALTTEGMSLFFAPNQVASAAAGPQQVDIPLRALTVYHPKPEFWAKASDAR